jgi:hypothetical protein
MLEGIICPNCEAPLKEDDLKVKLVCVACKTELKDRKYLDFLEYLMTNGIVENLDFFDEDVYSEDIERLEPDEEEDIDPSKFEKKKDLLSFYENEHEHIQNSSENDLPEVIEEFKGIEEDWEEFNRSDFSKT